MGINMNEAEFHKRMHSQHARGACVGSGDRCAGRSIAHGRPGKARVQEQKEGSWGRGAGSRDVWGFGGMGVRRRGVVAEAALARWRLVHCLGRSFGEALFLLCSPNFQPAFVLKRANLRSLSITRTLFLEGNVNPHRIRRKSPEFGGIARQMRS